MIDKLTLSDFILQSPFEDINTDLAEKFLYSKFANLY